MKTTKNKERPYMATFLDFWIIYFSAHRNNSKANLLDLENELISRHGKQLSTELLKTLINTQRVFFSY